MTRFGWMVLGGILTLLILIATVLVLFRIKALSPAPVTTPVEVSVQETDPSSLSIYTNGVYGFSFFYPADGVVTDSFASSSAHDLAWRTNASGKGTPIVRIQSTQGVLLVGVSTDSREKATCLKKDPAETKQEELIVGSTTWQHFSFEKVGTDNPQQVTSYRTLKGDACFAFEILEPLPATASSTVYALRNSITSVTFVP